MPTISSPRQDFRVSVRAGKTPVGYLNSTADLIEARGQLAKIRNAYPDSVLQVLADDGDLGGWCDSTDEGLDQIADVNAILALARIVQRRVPRITWTLEARTRGQLYGRADTREQVEEYGLLLGVTVEEEGSTLRTVVASGVLDGVPVQVSCYVRDEQPAAVSA